MKTNFKLNRTSKKENATLKSVIIAATLVITGAAASAQEVGNAYFDSNQETALVYAETSNESNNTVYSSSAANYASFAAYLVEENEEELSVEEWMTETENFGTFINIEEETESPLELKEWMLNEKTFEVKNEKEEPLKLENWMTAENIWK